MNCRKICSLLSAYIDQELTAGERQAVVDHLSYCSACRLEHETLLQTKQLVASLAHRTSREQLIRLLGETEREPLRFARPGPIAATALLSLASLWLATVSLDGPKDWHLQGPTFTSVPLMPAVTPPLTAVAAPLEPSVSGSGVYLVGQGRVVPRDIVVTPLVREPVFRDMVGRCFAPDCPEHGQESRTLAPVMFAVPDPSAMAPTMGAPVLSGGTNTGVLSSWLRVERGLIRH